MRNNNVISSIDVELALKIGILCSENTIASTNYWVWNTVYNATYVLVNRGVLECIFDVKREIRELFINY